MEKQISYEYIRGLSEGEGCFTFCSVGYRKGPKKKLPAFILSMSKRDEELIRNVRNTLNLKSTVYSYPPRKYKDGYRRHGMVILIVRRFGDIKNRIVPLFYRKLNGYKAKQFEEWIKKIETDPSVHEMYKLIPKLYKNGFYEKNFKNYD